MISIKELYRLARLYDGVPILGCLPGSPADRLGIRYGDILLEINGIRVHTLEGYALAARGSGEIVPIKLVRDGAETDFEVDTSAREPISMLQAAVYLAGPEGLGQGGSA